MNQFFNYANNKIDNPSNCFNFFEKNQNPQQIKPDYNQNSPFSLLNQPHFPNFQNNPAYAKQPNNINFMNSNQCKSGRQNEKFGINQLKEIMGLGMKEKDSRNINIFILNLGSTNNDNNNNFNAIPPQTSNMFSFNNLSPQFGDLSMDQISNRKEIKSNAKGNLNFFDNFNKNNLANQSENISNFSLKDSSSYTEKNEFSQNFSINDSVNSSTTTSSAMAEAFESINRDMERSKHSQVRIMGEKVDKIDINEKENRTPLSLNYQNNFGVNNDMVKKTEINRNPFQNYMWENNHENPFTNYEGKNSQDNSDEAKIYSNECSEYY